MPTSNTPTIDIDAAIIGGGIAGTWLLNLLSAKGYNVVLLEREALGADQTLASQGMIHGGLKYALAGALTGASEAIAEMPARWRSCLSGNDEVDLTGVALLSDTYYMFAESAVGKFAGLIGSRALRGRIDRVAKGQYPQAFNGFRGTLYALNDFVLDTASLLQTLVRGHEERAFRLSCDRATVCAGESGYRVQLKDAVLAAKTIISCAGNGAEALLETLAVPDLAVQHRPLKQVVVRPKHGVALFGHCLTNLSTGEPRLTITTHTDDRGMLWYLGGQIASTGVNRSDAEQVEFARRELEHCVRWLDWSGAEFAPLTVNRAEPRQSSGLKPDEAYVQRRGDFIQCFPTKLTLTPDLGDKVLAVLDPPSGGDRPRQSRHPRASLGQPPWS